MFCSCPSVELSICWSVCAIRESISVVRKKIYGKVRSMWGCAGVLCVLPACAPCDDQMDDVPQNSFHKTQPPPMSGVRPFALTSDLACVRSKYLDKY